MKTARIIFAVILGLFALIMLYNVFTVPVIAATAPAVLLIAASVAAYLVYPHHS